MRDKGWTVPHWPKEYGGGGLDGEEAKIVRQRWRRSARGR
jgi:alkylation response protein AidB-like acyl-CoA dehydrogenase